LHGDYVFLLEGEVFNMESIEAYIELK